MPNLLAIDCSTPFLVVGVDCQNKIVNQPAVENIKHTETILAAIDYVLNEAGCQKSELDAIVVGIGPGSFMGVRTAISTTQGLALALDIPVIPVSSLQLLAQSALLQNNFNDVQVAWDARMNEVYYNHFVFDAEQKQMLPVENTEDQVFSLEAVSVIESSKPVGNGWPDPACDLKPSAEALLQLGQLKFDQVIDVVNLQANYVRNRVADKPT